jgi:nucleotide-binding universal stress UspA family protein
VIVGYDGSREAAGALSSLAESGLAADRPIYIVSCHADASEATADCDIAGRFLRRHGLTATACPEISGEDPAQVLVECCRRYDAGLLVVGAFGHSTLREFLFGSTTRELLRELPVSLLLDR